MIKICRSRSKRRIQVSNFAPKKVKKITIITIIIEILRIRQYKIQAKKRLTDVGARNLVPEVEGHLRCLEDLGQTESVAVWFCPEQRGREVEVEIELRGECPGHGSSDSLILREEMHLK